MQQPQPVKTTLSFNPRFHRHLKLLAQRLNKPMAEVIEQELTPVLDKKLKERHRKLYDGLYALSGMVKEGNADASTSIDDFLYGKLGEGVKSEARGK